MAYLGILDWGMTIHHWICIIGMGAVVAMNRDSYYLIAAMFISEVSNPPMHMRMVLRHLGLRYSKSYELSELLYICTYSFSRVFLGIHNGYNMILCEHVTIVIKVLGVSILLQSYYYIYQMYFIMKSRYREYRERKVKGVKLRWCSALT